MNSTAKPPLHMGQLITAALGRVWHFKLELLLLWVGFLLTALIFVPFLRDFEAEFVGALRRGAGGQQIPIDTSAILRLLSVLLLLALFRSALTVLWLRLLRLGTVEAFQGGIKSLAVRTFGLFVRCLALLAMFIGTLLILRVVLNVVLSAFLSPGTTVTIPQSGALLALLLIAVIFGAFTVRVSFALVAPVFDITVPIEKAWALTNGNAFRILMAIIAVCFPIEFIATIIQSAIIRIGPASAQAVDAVAMTVNNSTGILMVSAGIGSITNCLEVAVGAAILIEAFDRLGGWGRGQFVSEVV